jgi:2-aminoadipate transaminase
MPAQPSGRRPRAPFSPPVLALVKIERDSGVPLYRQIARQLREAILTGDLPEGARLPTERALARELGVNRTTVMNAYNELADEGLIEGHVGRGTLVRRSFGHLGEEEGEPEVPSWLLGLAAGESELLGPDARVIGELISLGERSEVISFASAAPEPALLPAELFSAICGEALPGERQRALGYCPVEGLQSLRQGIAARMRRRGVNVDARHILILSGSTQGIGLVGRFLLHPGDEVVVEVPTYIGAIQAFRALGARVIGIPLDGEGLRLDLLESVLARHRPRLIYTLPTFQNPTGVVMSAERRRRLLLLCRRYQVPLLEDDTYGELYFETPPPPPIKALDGMAQVIYLSTFSKTLAPGLRVAWLAGPEPMIERLSLHKQVFDLTTNALGQWLVAEVLRRGVFDEHLGRVRACYRRKRDLMMQAIERYWPREVRVSRPGGGFHLWCRLPAGLRGRALLREAANERVALLNGEPFHVDGGGQQSIRLSYAYPEESQIEEGVRRIGLAMKRLLLRQSQEEVRRSPPEHIPMV